MHTPTLLIKNRFYPHTGHATKMRYIELLQRAHVAQRRKSAIANLGTQQKRNS